MTLRVTNVLCAFLLIAVAATPSAGQQADEQRTFNEIKNLGWQIGPAVGKVAARASLNIPANHGFLSAADTSKFLTLLQNLPQSDSYTLAPANLSWFAIFDFDPVGYVKDDEKVDADEVLQVLKDGNVRGNEERRRRGYPVVHLEGWFVAPHYDANTKRLEWATKLRSDGGGVSVNYKIRLLGRAGVMNAVLVSDPAALEKDMRDFKLVLEGFSFDAGERYAEYRTGDKVAEYGLAGLIVGGAAAAAAKSGLFKVIGKFAVFIFAGAAAVVMGLVRWLFQRRAT